MNDINGVELAVGDEVLFSYATSGYLKKGIIAKFTSEGLTIKYKTTDYSKYNKLTKTYDTLKDSMTSLRGVEGRIMKLG